MAYSSSNNGNSELYFGNVVPSGIDYEDNASWIVTSDGTSTGTPISFWKFDAETNIWVQVPTGGGSTCPAPMTRAALIALRNAGTLNTSCHYIITDYNRANVGAATILLHAIDSNTLSMDVQVKTTFDTLAWEGRYDIDTNRITFLADNLDNEITGQNTVDNFVWGNTQFVDNTLKNVTIDIVNANAFQGNIGFSRSNITVTSGNFNNNTISTDANVESAGNTQRNHFEAQSNSNITSGDFRENRVEGDANITSSTSGDVDNNIFRASSNTVVSNNANLDTSEIHTDANLTISGGNVTTSQFKQASNTVISGGTFADNEVGQDADVTIISGSNYENKFGKSTIYNQVGTGYIRYSNIEGTTSWINGNTNVSNVNANVSTINTTGSSGSIFNSTLDRMYGINMQNIPTLTITDSTISNYGIVQTNGANRIYIYRTTITDGSRFLCGTSTRIDTSYCNFNSYSYIQSTVAGSVTIANYCNASSLGYMRNLTANSNRFDRVNVSSSGSARFDGTASGCRIYYSNAHSGGSLYHTTGSITCYIYYSEASSLGQIYSQNSTNARLYYNKADAYSYVRSLNCPGTHYIYYSAATARGYIQMNNAGGRIYSCMASSQSILEKRGTGGNIYYSNFNGYFYAYLTRNSGTSSGLFGIGRRTSTVTNPTTVVPYNISSAWLNFS